MATSRSAAVIGSAQGIGRAIAMRLRAAGHSVTGVDIMEQELGEFADIVQADISEPEECLRVLSLLPDVDILVNSAAILIHKPTAEFSVKEFDQTIAVNLRAPFIFCQALAPKMAERHWGRIVNLSSIGAHTGGISHSTVYNSTKAALISITKNFARNFAYGGVTCNAVAPGFVATAMNSHVDEHQLDAYLEQIPVGRVAQSEEIASTVAFLITDSAAYITGTTIDVNGGWVMP